MSCKTSSILSPSFISMVTFDTFSDDLEVISLTPSIPFKDSSILVVMPSSIYFGEAPG